MYRNNSNKFPGGYSLKRDTKERGYSRERLIRERGLFEREAYSRERLIQEKGLFEWRAYSKFDPYEVAYSQVSNNRGGWSKRGGWKFPCD